MDTWHMTQDTWHPTQYTWHVTGYIWHVTHGWGWTFSQKGTKGERCSCPQHILGKVDTARQGCCFRSFWKSSLEWLLKLWDSYLIVKKTPSGKEICVGRLWEIHLLVLSNPFSSDNKSCRCWQIWNLSVCYKKSTWMYSPAGGEKYKSFRWKTLTGNE